MIRFVVLIACGLSVTACQNLNIARKGQSFDGHFFRTNAKKVGDDRSTFEVAVRNATVAIEAAQEAGRVESAKYCIENFGSSTVDWAIGPDDDPETYVLDGNTLLLRGTCLG